MPLTYNEELRRPVNKDVHETFSTETRPRGDVDIPDHIYNWLADFFNIHLTTNLPRTFQVKFFKSVQI